MFGPQIVEVKNLRIFFLLSHSMFKWSLNSKVTVIEKAIFKISAQQKLVPKILDLDLDL